MLKAFYQCCPTLSEAGCYGVCRAVLSTAFYELGQRKALEKGANQLCLLPITQDVQIDAQVFFF